MQYTRLHAPLLTVRFLSAWPKQMCNGPWLCLAKVAVSSKSNYKHSYINIRDWKILQSRFYKAQQYGKFTDSLEGKVNSLNFASATGATTAKPTEQNKLFQTAFFKRMFHIFEEVLHMDEVRCAQARVLEIKNQLQEIGNKKRAILRELDIVRIELHRVYNEMKIKTNRSSGQYVELLKEEVELCTKEDNLQKTLAVADEREQYLFNAFTFALSDSYEKEKIHTSLVKSLGVIGTILGSFITLILSVVGLLYNQRKFYTLREDVKTPITDQVLQKLDEVNQAITLLRKNQKQLETQPVETWGAYLKRHTRWMFSWAVPKKN